MSSILIKIFSGAHRGADLELPEGVYVVGTDDSCDIILSDSTLVSRHATFRIQKENERTVFLAEPLDGTLTMEDQDILQESSLPSRQPFFLSQVCMAWCLPSEIDFAWQEVEDRLAHRYSPENSSPKSDISAPAKGNAEMGATEENAQGTEISAKDDAETLALQPPVKKFPWKRCIALLLVLVLTGGLIFSWRDTEQEKTPVETMQDFLGQSGYTKLKVTGDEKSVTVSGRIASDSERGRLLRLSKLMPFPVYLDVQVGSDAAEAVKASFNSLGLYPEVKELPPSKHPGLLVQGYIKDAVLEEQALSLARKDVPELHEKNGNPAALSIFRDIRHAEDIEILMGPALSAAGLNHIVVEYLPGKVALHGMLTPQSREELEEILTKIKEKLGVSFPADIFNDASVASTPSSEPGKPLPAARSPETPVSSSMGFKVTSVAVHGLRFITLESGERVFEGGELPGGFTLEHIDEEALTLRKDQQTLNYPLRGAQ